MSAPTMTNAEAALRIARTTQTVRDLADRGTLRSVRTPLGRLIDPASVDELLRDRKATGSPSPEGVR